MDLRTLRSGWRRHLRHFSALRRRLARGQDPKLFCLSCSDSRVNVHEIFELNEPGAIFEVKNVGGLFSPDAKAALVFALAQLKPQYVIVMHHTRCGGYRSLAGDPEPEVKRHMVEYGGFHARLIVNKYISDNALSISPEETELLTLEEGCRLQVEAIISYLRFGQPRLYEDVKMGHVKVLPLIYHTVTGRVCLAPSRLDGSENTVRKDL